LKPNHEAAFASVSAALRAADPVGLIAMGVPDNEYAPGVDTILPRLRDASGVDQVLRIVHEELARGLGPDAARLAENYADAAQRVWRAWEDLEARR
jgi:uncharacterized protein YigA (DUF484 family)